MKKKLNQFNNKSCSWLVFGIMGFIAALISLLVSVLGTTFPNTFFPKISWDPEKEIIIILVIIEEVVRFYLMSFLCSNKTQLNISNIFNVVFFGLSFALFEILLILFSSKNLNLTSSISLLSIHSIISILIFFSVYYWKQKKIILITIFWFSLAFIIHLLYNLVIHIYIY